MIATLILIIPTYKVFLFLQIECAIKREKSAFDHINTDWNLPNEDGSTDFSDDETVIDERVSIRRKYTYIYSYVILSSFPHRSHAHVHPVLLVAIRRSCVHAPPLAIPFSRVLVQLPTVPAASSHCPATRNPLAPRPNSTRM